MRGYVLCYNRDYRPVAVHKLATATITVSGNGRETGSVRPRNGRFGNPEGYGPDAGMVEALTAVGWEESRCRAEDDNYYYNEQLRSTVTWTDRAHQWAYSGDSM